MTAKVALSDKVKVDRKGKGELQGILALAVLVAREEVDAAVTLVEVTGTQDSQGLETQVQPPTVFQGKAHRAWISMAYFTK
jgi:hypothetical protein